MGKHSPRDTCCVRGPSGEDLGINHAGVSGWPGEITSSDASELASVQSISQMVKDGRVIVVHVSYVDHGAVVATTIDVRDDLGEQLQRATGTLEQLDVAEPLI